VQATHTGIDIRRLASYLDSTSELSKANLKSCNQSRALRLTAVVAIATVATAAAVSTAATSPGALGLGCLAAEAFSLARKHIHAALRALPVARSDVAWQ